MIWYDIIWYDTIYDILGYNSNHMFRPNCKAIYRLIFKQVECTIDKAFNLRDVVL